MTFRLDPDNDPNEAYEVQPVPAELRGPPTDWWMVTANGVPGEFRNPGRQVSCRSSARRFELEPSLLNVLLPDLMEDEPSFQNVVLPDLIPETPLSQNMLPPLVVQFCAPAPVTVMAKAMASKKRISNDPFLKIRTQQSGT